jgi:rubrerythrin
LYCLSEEKKLISDMRKASHKKDRRQKELNEYKSFYMMRWLFLYASIGLVFVLSQFNGLNANSYTTGEDETYDGMKRIWTCRDCGKIFDSRITSTCDVCDVYKPPRRGVEDAVEGVDEEDIDYSKIWSCRECGKSFRYDEYSICDVCWLPRD